MSAELTDRQRRFVEEYLLDLIATQAAIRAGYSDKTAASQGERLLRHPGVARAIAAAQAARSRRVEITQDRVLQELGRVAMANADELVTHRVGCCRYCWGAGGRYQFTPVEWERAEADHQRLRNVEIAGGREDPGPLDPQGGVGFRGTCAPNPHCAECFGQGVGLPVFVDTSRMGEGARALYAGVKVTKDGMEMKVHSKLDALELVGRHLGMFKDKVELDASGGLAELLRAVDGRTRGLPTGGGRTGG